MTEYIKVHVEPSNDDGTEWSTECPIETCGRTVYVTQGNDDILRLEPAGCVHVDDFDWFEGEFKFIKPRSKVMIIHIQEKKMQLPLNQRTLENYGVTA